MKTDSNLLLDNVRVYVHGVAKIPAGIKGQTTLMLTLTFEQNPQLEQFDDGAWLLISIRKADDHG